MTAPHAPDAGPLDLLFENAGEVFTAQGPPLRGVSVGVRDGHIAWLGPQADLPPTWCTPQTQRCDLGGRLLTPGLVECHTHIVFAGDRADEYALRAQGHSYQQIAQAGGGILSTVRATRQASEAELIALARPRLARLLAQGVTTCEIKSGYGLDHETELRILRVIHALQAEQPIELVPTYLGAHVVPPEWRAQRGGYLDEMIQRTLPAIAAEGLAEFCDIFVEAGAFQPDEARRLLGAARALGFKLKLHVDQLSAGQGAQLAAELGAISADHLEHIDAQGIEALAQAGTVAVLLPGAALFLGQDDRAPARALIEAGVPVALSTDCNPGTCMSEHVQLMLTLGLSRLGLSPQEALEGVTAQAARALDRGATHGVIAVGRRADLAIFDVPDHVRLPYHMGQRHTWRVYRAGQRVWSAPVPST